MNTTRQLVALALVPKVSGFLSICGSSWIVIEVVTTETKRCRVFHRIMCCMSIVDLLSSVAYFASTWAIPTTHRGNGTIDDDEDDDEYYVDDGITWNIGNGTTCAIQGFFIQLSLSSSM